LNNNYNLSNDKYVELYNNYMSEELDKKLSDIIFNIYQNYNKRIKISELLLNQMVKLLNTCETNHISNIVVSTKRITVGNVVNDIQTSIMKTDESINIDNKNNANNPEDLDINITYWRLSLNDHWINNSLILESKNNDVRKINEIDKVFKYGKFEED